MKAAIVVLTAWILFTQGAFSSPAMRLQRYSNFIAAQEKDTKFQFSLRTEFFEGVPLYAAYTARGLWMRNLPSAPFKEIVHHPEVYWSSTLGEFGFEHESNGLDNRSTDYEGRSQRSRSMQRFYWRETQLFKYRTWALGLKLKAPVYVKAVSPYHDYVGIFDLFFSQDRREFEWLLQYRHGEKGGRVSLDLSLNPLLWVDPDYARRNRTWLFVQYFNGYAESLVDYSLKTESLRVGFRLLI